MHYIEKLQEIDERYYGYLRLAEHLEELREPEMADQARDAARACEAAIKETIKKNWPRITTS